MQVKCSYSELVSLDKLIPHPRNDNQHEEEHAKLIAKVMKARGVRHPIIVSKLSGFMVAGHLREWGAEINGWTEFPVDYQDFESEADEYAFLTSDNNVARYAELDREKMVDSLKDLDIDLETVDFEDFGLLDFELPEVEVLPSEQDDECPEPKEDPITKRGDIWILGNHRVMCGDSTMIDDVESLMNGEKADMVFTDPPYGDGHAAMEMNTTNIKRGSGNLVSKSYKIANDENLDIMPEVASNMILVSKEKSPKIVFFKWKKWEEVKDCWSVFGEPSSCCVWDRDEMAAATFIFNPCHEFAFFWGSLAEKKNKSNMSNVWRCKKERENKSLHPTVKPIEICENAIDGACERQGKIVDPFLGSGSTLIACEKTNRKCYGMELDEKYCDVIIKRYQEYTDKEAVLESSGETYNSMIKED